jgi:hypothetical protein
MNALSATMVVAEMQARDLLRRRAVMTLFVLLPAAFYYSVPASEDYSLVAGSMGVSWAVAAAGVFGILGWRRADPRLSLAGAPPAQGLLGRLLLLQALGLALVVLFAPQILWRSSALLADPGLAVLSLVLMAFVSVSLGLAIGALVPRELEGTLVLIGVLGVGMSVPPDSAVAKSLPMWGPLEVLLISAGLDDAAVMPAVAHAVVSALVLLAVAGWLWRRRTASVGARVRGGLGVEGGAA